MEARPRAKGGFSYRYHPVGGKPIPLGSDKAEALRKALDLDSENPDSGTVNGLWRLYQQTGNWKLDLSQGSRDDYMQSSKPLLEVFGLMGPAAIKPQHIARYLRVKRASAPVRANREFALLSNLMNLAAERGELEANPCKQVRRNKERPRKNAPEPKVLSKFLEWAWAQSGQSPTLAGMAEFASIAGNRGIEFRELTWPQVGEDVIRIMRSKQREKEVVEQVAMDGLLVDLMHRLRARAKDSRSGYVFPTSQGNAYTAQNFKLAFNRLKTAARKAGAMGNDLNFTFHDLRSYYVTQYKEKFGALPELHADPGTTARIYDSSKTVNRKTLCIPNLGFFIPKYRK